MITRFYAVAHRITPTAAEWFHGTPNTQPFSRFDFDQSRDWHDNPDAPRYWNSHLGSHFTSVHQVAADFAREGGAHGHVLHADVAMKNPKHYGTEDQMDMAAWRWAEDHGHDPRDGYKHGPAGLSYPGESLTHHPQAREIAHGFREHLQEQGHDGVIYGNTIEGPHGHPCAIPFHPSQIHIRGTHPAQESCADSKTASVTAFFRERTEEHTRLGAAETGRGIMVAIVPPPDVANQLVQDGGEPANELHVTLAYLGKTSDYTAEQLEWLPELVGSWAARQRPVQVRIGGAGTFHNGPEHVLWASVDIPGGAQLHTSLDAFLNGHGYRLPSEHGWNPHLTLAYVDQHFRFLPKLKSHSWACEQVWVCIGGNWTPHRLGLAGERP